VPTRRSSAISRIVIAGQRNKINQAANSKTGRIVATLPGFNTCATKTIPQVNANNEATIAPVGTINKDHKSLRKIAMILFTHSPQMQK
jgi:hypothetical protein